MERDCGVCVPGHGLARLGAINKLNFDTHLDIIADEIDVLGSAVLGLTIITNGDSPLVHVLQLSAEYTNGKAPPWCVCLAATSASGKGSSGTIISIQ